MYVLLQSPAGVDNSTDMSLDVGFGLRHIVREHRKRLRLTQDKLAELAGTTGETISRIERGVVEPSPETLRGLAPVFGVPVRELLALLDPDLVHFAGHGTPTAGVERGDRDANEGDPPPGDAPLIEATLAEVSVDEEEVLRLYRSLEPQVRDLIVRILRSEADPAVRHGLPPRVPRHRTTVK